MKRLRVTLLLSSLLLLASPIVVAKVSQFTLENGLQVFVKEDHRAPVVTTQVWYKVGSSYEYNGITGISHLLEHLMFRGSQKYGPGQYTKIVSENGGRNNAFTSYDFTGYFQLMSADKLDIAFDLEADRMRFLNLTQDNFDKELQIVLEERRMRVNDNPQALTYERFLAAAHVESPYRQPVIGWMDDIIHLTLEDAKKWYQTWYAPNNALLVVVGDVEPQQVLQLAQKHFGMLQPQTIPTLKPAGSAAPLGKRELEVKLPAQLPFLLMGYEVPVIKTINDKKEAYEPYALSVLSGLMSGGESALFERNLVRQQQIAAGVDTDYSPFSRLNTIFTISAVPADKVTVEQLKQAILEQITKLKQQPVTAEDLEKVKAQVIASKIYQKDSLLSEANELGSLEAVNLSWEVGDHFANEIKNITAEQVQAVATKYLTDERLTFAKLTPLPLSDKAKQAQPNNLGGQNVVD